MGLWVRTTVEVNDDLLRRAKRRATDEKTTLRQVLEEALRAHLSRRRPDRGAAFVLDWQTERGTLQPGVPLEDRDALFDLMDRPR